jgi:hypothetical protein
MAWTTEGAFEVFYSSINLPGEHRSTANGRREWVIQRLRSGGMNVLEAITMGSIPKYTALKGHADVDVMAVLHYGNHIENQRPSQVLSAVKNALNLGAAGTLRRNGQAVTVTFQSWPKVDVVPASRLASNGVITGYNIPDMTREKWLHTNPPQHAQDMASASTERGPNFRRVIKMIKHWNRRQATKLQSYHIEVIALQMDVSWTDHGYPIMKWFEAAQTACDWLWHAGSDVSGYLSWNSAQKVKGQLAVAERSARSAWMESIRNQDRLAISGWKSVFGQSFPSYG